MWHESRIVRCNPGVFSCGFRQKGLSFSLMELKDGKGRQIELEYEVKLSS